MEKVVGLEFYFTSLHATFSILNWLIQEAKSLHMTMILLEMFGQRQSDLSSVRVDLKENPFLYVRPPLTVVSYLSCDLVYMHNITVALLISVDISLEIHL